VSNFPNTLLDGLSIPVPATYVGGSPVGRFVAMAGSPTTSTDAALNEYTPIALDLQQIADQPVQMSGSDGIDPDGVMQIANGLFNGQTTDQQRGNLDTITLLNVSSVTTSQTSAVQTNFNHRGCIVILTTSAIGTGSVTLSIQGIEPVSNYVWTILAGTAVTTNTTVIYKVYPGLTASANSVASDILPRSWQVLVTANNANAASYAVYGMVNL
jgi:hypothetical protein